MKLYRKQLRNKRTRTIIDSVRAFVWEQADIPFMSEDSCAEPGNCNN